MTRSAFLFLAALALAGPPAAAQSVDDLYGEFIGKVRAHLGVFDDIRVFERDEAAGIWRLVSGQYIPVTVDGETPHDFAPQMRSDRPMMLSTNVEGYSGGAGQSSPYSVVGRMPGSNPEVEWVFLVRHYNVTEPSAPDFNLIGDMAVIGHHPRTGATAFFQFYDPATPKPGEVVRSPFGPEGQSFWSPLSNIVDFACQRCHSADAFIHTPWINQARLAEPLPGEAFAEPVVPSSPLGPYFFIGAGPGEIFEGWNEALVHLDDTQNQCTQCHRVSPYDLLGLNQNSTRYEGLAFDDYNKFALRSDTFQTEEFWHLPWMPPPSPDAFSFYPGQDVLRDTWKMAYAPSAAEVNRLTKTDERLAPVPAPPERYRRIMVDRPERDRLAPGEALLVVDSRMRANTDSDLAEWRFVAAEDAPAGMRAVPVVVRRLPSDGSRLPVEIVFAGAPRGADAAGTWQPLEEGTTVPIHQGDYLGLVLINDGETAGPALVPFTRDDWARLTWPDGTPRLADGVVAYRTRLGPDDTPDSVLDLGEPAYRTYSVEFRSHL